MPTGRKASTPSQTLDKRCPRLLLFPGPETEMAEEFPNNPADQRSKGSKGARSEKRIVSDVSLSLNSWLNNCQFLVLVSFRMGISGL